MTDTDRELLELAAKAAGYRVRWVDAPTSFNYEGFLIKTGKKLPNGLDAEIRWNPLTNDGDAFRLAVKLHMRYDVRVEAACVTVHCARPAAEIIWLHLSEGLYQVEETVATRRAIVRAAAEIGRTMDEIQRTKENR
jgi:hypothetical protein